MTLSPEAKRWDTLCEGLVKITQRNHRKVLPFILIVLYLGKKIMGVIDLTPVSS